MFANVQIVATLLLFLEEEMAFWQMSAILENLLPSQYYSSTLLGARADQVLPSFASAFIVNLSPRHLLLYCRV